MFSTNGGSNIFRFDQFQIQNMLETHMSNTAINGAYCNIDKYFNNESPESQFAMTIIRAIQP